ncbi:HET-domain-containing protein, partial [Thozetella sp. PMI_491]
KDRINYAMIQSWITFCQSKHGHLCSPPITKIIERLRVIDVDSLRVIAAPENCNYVALSYVWGSHATPTDSFSQVVRDSSVVAKKLGYKYLWVDKHCIDQDSPADKHEQVQAMHVIYGNARLTLIAAAGEDCQYGLPGVASRERIEQSALSIDGNLYVQNFPHVSQAVGGSRWATRGWTLQEGLLSHRRLIFTDHQVAFQCYGMHCVEAVHWPYELMHAKSSHRFPENVPRPPLGRQIQDQQYYNTLQPDFKLLSLLEEYSNRTLSYPSDSLNAFLGVLSSFASRKHPIYHVWGVP